MVTETTTSRVAQGSRAGGKSRTNEDSVLVLPARDGADSTLFCAVADGVGGLDRGDVASKAAVEALAQGFPHDFGKDPAKVLREVALAAHEAVRREAGGGASGTAGATTLVAALVREGELWVANAGDSRAYLLTPGRGIAQVTSDHSWVQEQVRAGILDEAEAARHPNRKVITRCLGGAEPPEVDVFHRRMVPGSRLLLCSDGLTEVVRSSELAQVLSANEPEAAVSILLTMAEERGAPDDATVCVVEPEVPPLLHPDESEEDTKQQRLHEATGKRRRSYTRLLLWAAFPPAVALLAGVLLRATDDVIVPGVSAAGMDLGGRSREEAAAVVSTATVTALACSQEFTVGGFRWSGPAAELGLSVDRDATTAAAWRLGHEGPQLDQARQRLDIATKGAAVNPVLRLDQEVLTRQLEQVARQYEGKEPGWGVDVPAAVGVASRHLVERACTPLELPAKTVSLPPPATAAPAGAPEGA